MFNITVDEMRKKMDQHADVHTAVGKLLVVWITTLMGMTITEWAALFAILYTLLQIYILVRDKIWRDGKPKVTDLKESKDG